jgi:hypothetical protein
VVKEVKQPAPNPGLLPLILLLLGVVFLIPLQRPLFGLPVPYRFVLGGLSWVGFVFALKGSSFIRPFVTLFIPLLLLVFAPIHTDLGIPHIAVLLIFFAAVVFLPPLLLKDPSIITFKLFPDKVDWVDVFYTVISIPLAWGAFRLYFGTCSPEVPANWVLPATPDGGELLKLFLGINGVGIWDELFFINICYAVFRSLYPARIAIPAQAVIYVVVLYDMAFTGWGPVFVGFLALTQGLMYERSRVLIWVLIVHLIVDYFLFQAIVEFYYPDWSVWWHP